jgi:hypothetical protein
VTGRIVRSGVQREVHEQGALVLGGVQVGSTESVGQVITVERSLGGLVDGDSVGLELQSLDGLANVAEHNGLGGNSRAGVLVRSSTGGVRGIELDIAESHHFNLRAGLAVELLVRQQGESVPVAVLVQVVARDVLGGSQSNEHVLDGPLHLRQELRLLSVDFAELLVSVHADEGESDALYVDVPKGRFLTDLIIILRVHDQCLWKQ